MHHQTDDADNLEDISKQTSRDVSGCRYGVLTKATDLTPVADVVAIIYEACFLGIYLA